MDSRLDGWHEMFQPDAGEDDDDGTVEGDDGNDGDDPASESGDDDADSPLPELEWTYSGTYRSDSLFFIQSQRDAFGLYDSGTLSGLIAENFFFRVSAGHDEELTVQPDGELQQISGENRLGSRVQFSFDLNVSGSIDGDNPHSGGLTGTVAVINHASGGAFFSLEDQFSAGGSTGNWNTDGESFDWMIFNSSVDVDLGGSVNRSIGGVDTSVAITYEMFSHSGGTGASRFTLNTSRLADQTVGNDDPWLQIVGVYLTDSVSRSESTMAGASSGGMLAQTTRTRSEHSTWTQLYAPETEPGTGDWGDGGRSVDDYFFSLTQASNQSQSLTFPMGETGGTLSGGSYSNSFDTMLVRSNEGQTFGDGGDPPRIDPSELGGLDGRVALPLRPPGTGSAVPPDSDDPDGASDWASANYGRIRVSQSGNSAAGFSLAGGYSVDAGAATPASATRNLSSQYTSGYEFSLTSRKLPSSGQWKNIAGSRDTSSAWGENSSFIVSGNWGIDTPQMAVSGPFLDSQIETSSGASSASGQLDPASGTWSNIASNSFAHDVDNVRTSDGSGTYWHDRFGFEVSGGLTVANEHNYRTHHSTTLEYVDGNLTSNSTGDRYTQLSTRSMHSSSGSGVDERIVITTSPYFYFLETPVGTNTNTTTYDHSATEGNLRDFSTRDRSDWRFDASTGTLVPTQRVQVYNQVIDVSLDLTYDTTGESEFEGSYTQPAGPSTPTPRINEFGGEAITRYRETTISGESTSRTSTLTTPFEGPGAGEVIVTVTGSDAVKHSSYAWLQSSSGTYNEEINGSDGYYRQQTNTEDWARTTFDALRSTQRIDGTGDTRHHGNRTLSGNGWLGHWFERLYYGFDIEETVYHMPLSPDFDRPDSYDVTVDINDSATIEIPSPYRLPDNLPENTTPGGSLGPDGFAPEEDSQAITGLKDEVANNGSAAASANAARDAAFAEMAESTESFGDPSDPGSQASEDSLSAAAGMATYVDGQGSVPMPGNPTAVASGAAGEANAAGGTLSQLSAANIPDFLQGMATGFISDGAGGLVDGVKTAVSAPFRYIYFAFSYYSGGLDAASQTSMGQSIDSATTLALKYGPVVARIIQEIQSGNLSDETKALLASVQPLIDEIVASIADEIENMSAEEKAELLGRITGAVLFEAALLVGTAGTATALSAAAKSGKLANIASKFGGLSSNLTEKISAAIGRFVAKVDDIAPKHRFNNGGCFVAGTLVHVATSQNEYYEDFQSQVQATRQHGSTTAFSTVIADPVSESILVAIENVSLGSRIDAINPLGTVFPSSAWLKSDDLVAINMTVERVKGGTVEVELLRPETDFKRYKPGDRLPIFLAEIGELDGTATIHSITPCQTPADGHGNVVTGRFKTRLASGINQVWLSNRDSFAGTASHPIWVCNRKEFVRLDDLQVGDRLDTLDGTSEVVRIESLSVPQDVFNIEVDSEHVYRIGSTGVLVHNVGDDDCPLVNIGDAARKVPTGLEFEDYVRTLEGGHKGRVKFNPTGDIDVDLISKNYLTQIKRVLRFDKWPADRLPGDLVDQLDKTLGAAIREGKKLRIVFAEAPPQKYIDLLREKYPGIVIDVVPVP